MSKSVFETLSKIDVSNHVDTIKMKKGPALSYVSWSWAWSIVKSYYPDTPTPKYMMFPEMKLKTHTESYEVEYMGKKYKRYRTVVDSSELTDRKVPYLTTPTGTMVECTVTIEGEPYSEYLFVMNNSNQPIINPTTSEINKTQKRCMVKALALAGLGLNLYAGEDLPMGEVAEKDKEKVAKKEKVEMAKQEAAQKEYQKKLDRVAEVTGKDVGTIESGIKDVLKNKHPEFDDWSDTVRKTAMIDMLQRILEKHKEPEQQTLEEVE